MTDSKIILYSSIGTRPIKGFILSSSLDKQLTRSCSNDNIMVCPLSHLIKMIKFQPDKQVQGSWFFQVLDVLSFRYFSSPNNHGDHRFTRVTWSMKQQWVQAMISAKIMTCSCDYHWWLVGFTICSHLKRRQFIGEVANHRIIRGN